MDDVKFGRSGPYGDVWKAEPLTYYHWRRCDTGAESDVYECLVSIEFVKGRRATSERRGRVSHSDFRHIIFKM